MKKITVWNVNFQRNGVMGEPFYSVKFTDESEGVLIGVLTGRKGGCYIVDQEHSGKCFRGDFYEDILRGEVVKWYAAQYTNYNVGAARDELNADLTEAVY